MKTVNNSLGLKIKTKNGYRDFAAVAMLGIKDVIEIRFTNRKSIRCTSDHKIITPKGGIPAGELEVGDRVYRADGRLTRVKSRSEIIASAPVYDIIEVDGGHTFIANGVEISNCEFVSDDETLIHALTLQGLKPTDPEFYTGTVRWYREPLPNRAYTVALDPSLGTGGDFSAIQVFMLPEMEQVAEWQSNITDTRGQVKTLMQILTTLDGELRDHPDQQGDPEIFWTFENNSIGEATLVIIDDTGEEKFAGQLVNEKKRKGQSRRFRKGLNTDNRKKLSACVRLKSLIESGRMKVHSSGMIRELKTFVARGASYSAKSGTHDDLISASLLSVRMLEVVANWLDADHIREGISDDELFGDDDGPDTPMPMAF